MKKKFLILIISLAFLGGVSLVSAQSPTVQKAVQDVRDRVDDLAQAKDENDPGSAQLRLEAFEKVLDLSIAEAKDLKIKLLSVDPIENEDLLAWRDKMIDALNTALKFYDEEKDLLSSKEASDPQNLKRIAESFRDWRETEYLPVATEINDFLLIEQEGKAIQTAKNRSKKIENDLASLAKSGNAPFDAKNIASLRDLLQGADELIAKAEEENQEGSERFFEIYVSGPNSTSTASSSETISAEEPSLPVESQLSSATDEVNGSSTDAAPPPPPPSIRDLVKSSLDKIKESYRIFIEMSDFVRKLLE